MITSFNLGYLSSGTTKVFAKHYVVEPILRWAFCERGYALVHAACFASGERAFMVTAPWVVFAPAAAIVSLIIGVNLLGDGRREWLAARNTADE